MKQVKLVRQAADNECGLCCISMVANYYNFCKPLSYYRNKFSVGRDGTSIKSINEILKSIKLNPSTYKIEDINEFSFKNKPYISYQKNNHFVVIQEKQNGTLVVSDPSNKKMRMQKSVFQKQFGGYIVEVEKDKDFKTEKMSLNDFRYIIQILSKVKLQFLSVLLLSILMYVASIAIPMLLKDLINSIADIGSINIQKIIASVGFLILTFFFVSYIRINKMVKLQTNIFEKLSKGVIHHLFGIAYSFFDNRSKGNILFRIGLLSQIQTIISYNFVQLIVGFTSTLVVILYFIFFQPLLIPTVICILLFLGLLVFFSNTYLLKVKNEEMSKKSDLNSLENEIVVNMYQIKSLKYENYFSTLYDETFDEYKSFFVESQKKVQLLNQLISIFSTFVPIIVIVIMLMIESKNTIGDIFAIYTLITMLLSYSTTFFAEVSNLTLLKSSLFYLNDILDEYSVKNSGKIELNEFQSLTINNLDFKYNDTSKFALKNISMKISKGDKVSIVGFSGSGKSSFIKLLACLYPITKGHILINDIDINDISSNSFSKIVSIVPQSPIIFNKTIIDNITLGDSSYSVDDVNRVLKMVNLYDEISKMPMGLNTMISDQGNSMSGGQIQRLAIARALLKQPKLLVLDESTSSLDSENEKIIYTNLKSQSISLLTISHRLSTISDSDNIYVFNDGEIIECGTHAELLNHKGYYEELFTNQYIKE